ncbi:hypothetical protein MJO29_004927 [Puccinia striiformis f. sp. tritici]|uniref:hypothetical protein n=1 Tax=Puccinia striiformis f. sp. tritici TaxID=168172 RepID=UPI0020075396|nr:hypothetical protein Pst134EA_009061 [Puccinia striiformis f. sp. tritici]KAH9468521.1 hypothetical protein Pst134EA_009061 [Puccinia striiformis f. sp. tritici]KAI7959859.1 hypothetical protein MJO29_004927 [Puccinia striiformis f. sp. tritici]KAI9622118.1 hypothetical protein KEM48_007429 [Puccinia striiformis f. sp. tritici PST-130]
MRCSLISSQEITDNGVKIDPNIPTIILLKAGILVPEAALKYGSYHEVFSIFFQNGFNYESSVSKKEMNETKIQLVSYNVMDVCDSPSDRSMEYPSPEILDKSIGLVISGSACNAYEDIKWINELTKFTRKVIDGYARVKLIGICFGHQIMARSLGSKVARNPLGWEYGIYEIALNSIGKELFKVDDGILKLHQVHRDIVNELPEGTYNLGTTSICKIQGIIKMNDPNPPLNPNDQSLDYNRIRMICLQGHPEFNYDILKDSLNYRTKDGTDWDVVDQESYTFALESLVKFPGPLDHHGHYIASIFLQILNVL